LKKEVDEANICFFTHRCFIVKNCRADQEEPGMRTFFNMLGPMVNPATPNFNWWEYLVLRWRGSIIIFFSKLKAHSPLFTATDGYDEISLTNDTKVITNEGKR
jgi:anthranilate phosphoribosyltransferase